MKNFCKELFGCLFGALIIPCIGAIFVIITSFHQEMFNFIKSHIPITINIIAIIIIAILSIKLYLSEKNFTNLLKNSSSNSTYYLKELEDYKSKYPSKMLDEISALKKENTNLKDEINQLNRKLQITSIESKQVKKALYTSQIDKIVHLYNVAVDYTHINKNESERKADFYNQSYPIGIKADAALGYADIDIVYFKTYKKTITKVFILNTLFFNKERTRFISFDKYNSDKPDEVKNVLMPDKFTYVVANDFKKLIIRFTSYTYQIELERHRDKRKLKDDKKLN